MNYLDIQLYPNLDEIPLEPLLQKIKLNLDKNGKMVADSQFNNDVCIKPQLFKWFDNFLWDKKRPKIRKEIVVSKGHRWSGSTQH